MTFIKEKFIINEFWEKRAISPSKEPENIELAHKKFKAAHKPYKVAHKYDKAAHKNKIKVIKNSDSYKGKVYHYEF